MEGIIEHPKGIAIINGGNPIDGCPTDWDWAKKWEDTANGKATNEDIKWRFDCGFKLDYDGDIVRISSRFYPPKSNYGPKWDGTTSVMFFDKTIEEHEFECDSLDELQRQVEKWVSEKIAEIGSKLGIEL